MNKRRPMGFGSLGRLFNIKNFLKIFFKPEHPNISIRDKDERENMISLLSN